MDYTINQLLDFEAFRRISEVEQCTELCKKLFKGVIIMEELPREIYKVQASRAYGRVTFVVLSSYPTTEDEALRIQQDEGYHPAGYGFYDFTVEKGMRDYKASWNCRNSCD